MRDVPSGGIVTGDEGLVVLDGEEIIIDIGSPTGEQKEIIKRAIEGMNVSELRCTRRIEWAIIQPDVPVNFRPS